MTTSIHSDEDPMGVAHLVLPDVPTTPTPIDATDALRVLIANGLTFGSAVNVFAEFRSETELAYVAAAAEKHAHDEGDIEVDPSAAVSEGDDPGAYVMAWTWVTKEDAGVVDHDELYGPALREHLAEVHGVPESERQDLSDPACLGLHEKLHPQVIWADSYGELPLADGSSGNPGCECGMADAVVKVGDKYYCAASAADLGIVHP